MFCIPANYSKFNPPLNPPGDPPSEVILKNFDILGPCWFSSVDLPHARSKLGWTTLRFWRLTTVTSQSRSMPTSSSSGETGGSKWTCPRLGNTSVIWSRQYDYKDAWGRASLIMLLIISIKNWRQKKILNRRQMTGSPLSLSWSTGCGFLMRRYSSSKDSGGRDDYQT